MRLRVIVQIDEDPNQQATSDCIISDEVLGWAMGTPTHYAVDSMLVSEAKHRAAQAVRAVIEGARERKRQELQELAQALTPNTERTTS